MTTFWRSRKWLLKTGTILPYSRTHKRTFVYKRTPLFGSCLTSKFSVTLWEHTFGCKHTPKNCCTYEREITVVHIDAPPLTDALLCPCDLHTQTKVFCDGNARTACETKQTAVTYKVLTFPQQLFHYLDHIWQKSTKKNAANGAQSLRMSSIITPLGGCMGSGLIR